MSGAAGANRGVGWKAAILHHFCSELKAASSGAAAPNPWLQRPSNFVTMDAQKLEIGRREAEDPEYVSLYVGVSCGRAFRPFAALTFNTTRPDNAESQLTER